MTDAITVPDPSDRASALSRMLVLLVVWFFAALWLGLRGALGGSGGPPLGLGLALTLPLLVYVVDARFGHPLFGALAHLDLASLAAWQTFRVGGVFFLVAWSAGSLPGAFALPAALGDIAVGLTAPLVAAAVARRRPGHRAIALAWNLAGVADLITAVTMGVTHSSSSFGVLAGAIRTDALGRYPFSLIPSFLVPLALLLHVTSLRRLAAHHDPS
jgi:hypothetical protein